MRSINNIICLTVLLFFWGCATPYQPKGLLGGYSSEPLGNDMLDVRFEGNQNTSQEQVNNYLLYRCAELTIENGFKYFVILVNESHFIADTSRPELDQPFSTRTSASAGTRTSVSADLSASTTSSRFIGIFKIGMLSEIEPAYADNIISAENILQRLEYEIK